MSTSPLSPQEIRAAAAAHKELGPEYSDAVVESFLERVDREITARVDARLGPVSREQPAQSNSRRTLLAGVAIGIFVTGVPSMMVAASAGGVISKDEAQVLFIVAILLAIAVGIGAFVYPISHYRRNEHGVRQTGRQAP
jgi:N-methylhydantoinase A/oxoprolinase/acetone carboxylase beta subunit